MRILLVNDDGILAAGLAGLRKAVADLGEVTVVAPDSPQSAAGRSITLHAPIPCQRVHVGREFWGIAVAGSPADCVKLAIRKLMDSPPDLVLAGINAGANVGINVFYSGTVAAAAEGALFGIPSVAFSLAGGGTASIADASKLEAQMDFVRAGRLCRWILEGLLAAPVHLGELVNVNIPALEQGSPRGVKVVPQSTVAINEVYVREDNRDSRLVFRLTDEYEHGPQHSETDVTALAEGYVTITPLHSDLTDQVRLAELDARRWGRVPD